VRNEQLKLEVLRWRKQSSLLRLKLASAKEDVHINERNLAVLADREKHLGSPSCRPERQVEA